MTSIIAELEFREREIEGFLVAHFGHRKTPNNSQFAHLRMLVGEYLEWHERNFGRQPKINPIKCRFKFLQMRKRKSRIPISAVA